MMPDFSASHFISVTLEASGDINVRFYCQEPYGASCRLWCEEGCVSTADEGHDTHRLVDQGYCTKITGWFDDDPFDAYSGRSTPLRSGAIEFAWEGEYYSWFYAGERDE